MLAALLTLAAAPTAARSPECTSTTFPLDLGNTHCPAAAKIGAANTSSECMAACCAAGDACETWQWCEAGKPCADGFWAQPGALARGGDLPGWPKNTTVAAAEAACAADAACIGLTYKNTAHLDPVVKIYLKNHSSGAVKDSSWSRRMKASAGCANGLLDRSCANASDGWSSRAVLPRPAGPCDVFAAAGTPCVAAHSVVQTLYSNYTGPLYRVLRGSDKAGLDIGAHHDGFAKTADQDAFCKGSACFILRIFDQSGPGSNRQGVQGAHLNPLGLFLTTLGLFLRTSIPFI